MQNMHDLLVGTVPGYIILHCVIPGKNPNYPHGRDLPYDSPSPAFFLLAPNVPPYPPSILLRSHPFISHLLCGFN